MSDDVGDERGWLHLYLKEGQTVYIGPSIEVKVKELGSSNGGKHCWLSFSAPKKIRILRDTLCKDRTPEKD